MIRRPATFGVSPFTRHQIESCQKVKNGVTREREDYDASCILYLVTGMQYVM